MKVTLCDPYIYEDPLHFLRNAWGKTFQCAQGRAPCASELVNQIIFVYLFTVLAGSLAAIFLEYPLAIVIAVFFSTVYLIPAFRALNDVKSFGDPDSSQIDPRMEPFVDKTDVIGLGASSPAPYTTPTAANPFMNVMLDEIKYNPMRAGAQSISDPEVSQSLDDLFRVQFTSDPTDVFGKTQSQRQFISMPSTTVPNDQGSFADWLYKIPGKTCKEGGREACMPGTDGTPVTWLNVSR
jgi:hypothetical protein